MNLKQLCNMEEVLEDAFNSIKHKNRPEEKALESSAVAEEDRRVGADLVPADAAAERVGTAHEGFASRVAAAETVVRHVAVAAATAAAAFTTHVESEASGGTVEAGDADEVRRTGVDGPGDRALKTAGVVVTRQLGTATGVPCGQCCVEAAAAGARRRRAGARRRVAVPRRLRVADNESVTPT